MNNYFHRTLFADSFLVQTFWIALLPMGLATKTKAYFFFLTSPTATPINPLNLHALPILGRLRKKEKKKASRTLSNHAKTNLHLVRSLKNVSSIYEFQVGHPN